MNDTLRCVVRIADEEEPIYDAFLQQTGWFSLVALPYHTLTVTALQLPVHPWVPVFFCLCFSPFLFSFSHVTQLMVSLLFTIAIPHSWPLDIKIFHQLSNHLFQKYLWREFRKLCEGEMQHVPSRKNQKPWEQVKRLHGFTAILSLKR